MTGGSTAVAAGEDQEMKRETRMGREENAIDVWPPHNEQKEPAIRDVRQRRIWTLKSAKICQDLKEIQSGEAEDSSDCERLKRRNLK